MCGGAGEAGGKAESQTEVVRLEGRRLCVSCGQLRG